MKPKTFRIICGITLCFAVLFQLFVLISCTTKKDGEHGSTSKDSITVPKFPDLNRIVLYLDASVSMQGYLKPSVPTNFAAIIGSIESFAGNKAMTEEFLYKGSAEPIDNLKSKISTANVILDAQESDIAKMISDMASAASENDTTAFFLVTDGILSASNDVINEFQKKTKASDKVYNIVHRKTLSENVRSSLKPYKNKISAIVLQFSAPFHGKYSKYNNSSLDLKDDIRPYYVLIIGQPHITKFVYMEINEMQTNQDHPVIADYENEALFGFDFILNKPQFVEGQDGIVSLDGKYKISSKVDSVSIVYDVSTLPAKLLMDEDSLKAYTTVFAYNKIDSMSLDKNDYEVKYENGKLTIIIKDRTDIYIPGSLEIRLGWWLPSWIQAMTDLKDDNPRNNKTFNLRYLLSPFAILNAGKDGEFLDKDRNNIFELTNK